MWFEFVVDVCVVFVVVNNVVWCDVVCCVCGGIIVFVDGLWCYVDLSLFYFLLVVMLLVEVGGEVVL